MTNLESQYLVGGSFLRRPVPRPRPPGVLWEATGLKGDIPPFGQTDLKGGVASADNEFAEVEMDGNSVLRNNRPDLSLDPSLRYNDRPGKAFKTTTHGVNVTGSGYATKRALFRVNYPFFTPTDNGNDNEVWFGFAYFFGAGYEPIEAMTPTFWHNIFGFRHFTSIDPAWYLTAEFGNLVMRRSAQPGADGGGWSARDGLGSNKITVGTLHLGWNTVVVHAKLSRTATNALREVWVNGVKGPVQTTANISGTSSIRIRLGVYNDTRYLVNRTSAFTNVRLGTSFAAVDPESLG